MARVRDGLIGAAALAAAVAACGSPDADRTSDASGRPAAAPAASADRDAEHLGTTVLQLLDHAAAYRSSHRGRLPATVAQLGLDSLSPETVRRLRTRNDSSVVQVAFRRPAGRALAWCEATTEALEEASLNAGTFTVWCERTGGGADSFAVGGVR